MKKIYQEKNSYFSHNGKKYDLNIIFKIVHNKPTKEIDLNKLVWILDYVTLDPKRVKNANLVYPIIVLKEKNKYIIVDGIHRFKKWYDQWNNQFDELYLPILAKQITQKELKKALVK